MAVTPTLAVNEARGFVERLQFFERKVDEGLLEGRRVFSSKSMDGRIINELRIIYARAGWDVNVVEDTIQLVPANCRRCSC